MAKKDGGKGSKTNVMARAELKAQQATCRFCGKKPEVVRVLTPSAKRRCSENAVRRQGSLPETIPFRPFAHDPNRLRTILYPVRGESTLHGLFFYLIIPALRLLR